MGAPDTQPAGPPPCAAPSAAAPPPAWQPPPPPQPYAAPPPGPYGPPGFPPPPPGAYGAPPPPGYFPAPAPIAGMQIRPPMVPPQPGQIVTGYEVVRPAAGCCQFDGLSPAGLIAIIILVLIFWPLAWVPCVMPDCYEPYQRPIYGWPVQQQQQGPPPPPPPPPPYQQAP